MSPWSSQVVLVALAVGTQVGCHSLPLGGSSLPSAKELADHFGLFPVGTPLSAIRSAAPHLFPTPPQVAPAQQHVDYWLAYNLSSDQHLRLYRLYPRDVLTTTARDDDQVALFPVRERLAYGCPDGAFEVLLSADGRQIQGLLCVLLARVLARHQGTPAGGARTLSQGSQCPGS
jgi:hypothetical protein